MRAVFIIILLISVSCSVSKKAFETSSNSGKAHFEFKNDDKTIAFNGLVYVATDTSIFNLFGLLGINVSKVGIFRDSIVIVDLINKKVYKSFYSNISKSVNNIFKGNFDKQEKQLICSIFSMSLKEKNSDFLNCTQNETAISYKIINRRGKRNISLSMKPNNSIKYNLKIKFVPVLASRISTFNLDKYNKFENISIKLR